MITITIKYFIFIGAYFILSCKLLAQVNTYVEYDINFKFVKGIYLTFDEFRNNNPSIQNDFYLIDKNTVTYFSELNSIKFMENYPFRQRKVSYSHLNNDSILLPLEDIWGFTDSEFVYFFKGYKIYRVNRVGIISEVEEWDKKYFFKSKTAKDTYLFENFWETGNIVEKSPTVYENASDPCKFSIFGTKLSTWYLNLKTGNLFLHSKFSEEIENTIQEDEDIYNQYLNDSIKYQRKIYKSYRYYLLFSKKYPVYFPQSN